MLWIHFFPPKKTIFHVNGMCPPKSVIWTLKKSHPHSDSSYSSSIDSTTLGRSWSVQQFYSIPVCPLPSPSNQ